MFSTRKAKEIDKTNRGIHKKTNKQTSRAAKKRNETNKTNLKEDNSIGKFCCQIQQ
jgi:hypothetical protein